MKAETATKPRRDRFVWPEELPGAAIESVGYVTPARASTNEPIADRLGVSSEWITARTGVRNRYVASPQDKLCDLAARAGERALEQAGVPPAALDLVLVATWTQDQLTPNAAPLVAAKLGATRAATIDVGAACTAFVSALTHAASYIEAGHAQAVLVIGADIVTRHVNYDDKRTAGLFGDGAGAVVIAATEPPGRIGPIVLRSDGLARDLICASRDDKTIRMNGYETFQHAVRRLCEVTREACSLAQLEPCDIDLFVYHQANSRILQAVGQELGLAENQVVDYVARFGNTSAASIPMALGEAEAENLLTDGSRIFVGAFGAGLTWGGGVIEWKVPGA